MANIENISSEKAEIIPLHFDVSKHALPLKQFVNSAEALQAIIIVNNLKSIRRDA